jgi:hypothetical protein
VVLPCRKTAAESVVTSLGAGSDGAPGRWKAGRGVSRRACGLRAISLGGDTRHRRHPFLLFVNRLGGFSRQSIVALFSPLHGAVARLHVRARSYVYSSGDGSLAGIVSLVSVLSLFARSTAFPVPSADVRGLGEVRSK